ncbi:hypothetical protein [Nitrosopumilus sp.]|uniref:hypothetical protein n=1 Tax=Nitrosopumilus sp. TaxID=2024843 RepID=UPI003D0CEAE8
MHSENEIVGKCRDFQLNDRTFKKFNRPAMIITILAIVIPIAILVPTSTENEEGELDITTSPYAPYGGIGFLAGIIVAYILSKKASKYKIRANQEWAIYTLIVYENIIEYQREKAPEEYLTNAKEKLEDLIEEIQSKIDNTDDKVQWIIPFVNPINELVNILDNKIYPIIESSNKQNIPQVKSYLIKLMTYFISPSKSLLEELIAEKILIVEDKPKLKIVKSARRPLPFKNFGIFVIFLGIGIVTFLLAPELDVDKNSAFLAAASLTGALSGGYLVYIKK